MCKIAINPNTATAINITNNNMLNAEVPHVMRMIIFEALKETHKPTELTNLITTVQEEMIDIHSLFKQLHSRYGRSSEMKITTLQLEMEFIAEKTLTELMEQFFERFKDSMKKVHSNMDNKILATHYLSSPHDNWFSQIIVDIANHEKTQWYDQGIKMTHHKAIGHLIISRVPRVNRSMHCGDI